MSEDLDRNLKQMYIEGKIEALCRDDRTKHLFPEGAATLKRVAMDTLIDLPIDEIKKNIDEVVTERKDAFDKRLKESMEQIKEKAKSTMDDIEILDAVPVKKDDKKESLTEPTPDAISHEFIHMTQPNTSDNKVLSPNNDLDSMMQDLDNNKKESSKVHETSINKQYVKKDNPKQGGFISVFNITLALLIMTGLILIAMILNVVLK